MDDNTAAVIRSNANHALGEVQGVLDSDGNPEGIWHATRAAMVRLQYILELLAESGFTPPE